MEVVIAQEEEEKIENAKKDGLKRQSDLNTLYEEARILGLDNLFDSMFSEDFDAQKLLPIGPVQINELKEEYRTKFEIVVNELKHFVLKRSNDKKDEIQSLETCIQGVKNESDQEAAHRLNEFLHQKKEVCLYVLLTLRHLNSHKHRETQAISMMH